MLDIIDEQDALDQIVKELLGIPPDGDAKQWLAEVLNISMEQLEAGLTFLNDKVSELGSLENPSTLYKVNVRLSELFAFLAKLDQSVLEKTRLKEVIERLTSNQDLLDVLLILHMVPHIEEMRAREDLEPVFSFCDQMMTRYTAEYRKARKRAQEEDAVFLANGTLRVASLLRPSVEFQVAVKDRSPGQMLRCWADAYEGQIYKITSFIWYLAQECGLVKSDATKPSNKGPLFQEAIRLAKKLELPFPFHRDLPKIRNATNHNSCEQISETEIAFFKKDGSEQFRLTTDQIVRCAERDIQFAAMFDHVLNLVVTEYAARKSLMDFAQECTTSPA